MPSTHKTPSIGLNKWELTDKPKMADFNHDNEAVDNFAADQKQRMTNVEKKASSNEGRLDALRVGTINRLECYNSDSYNGPGNIVPITDKPNKRRGFKWSGMSTGSQTLEIKTLPIEPNSDYVLAFLENIEGSFTNYEIKLAYTSEGQQYKSIVKQGSTSQTNGYVLRTHKFSIPSGATNTKIQFVVQGATSSTSLNILNLLLARGNIMPDYNLAPEDVLQRLDLLLEKDTSLQNQINQKAAKGDVLLKVSAPIDRDCNSFKDINTFCTFDTGDGDFKNTPDGTLSQGSAQVFMVVNRGHHSTRLQQEFIYLYPKDSVARYKRNFDGTRWSNWYKMYDSANKPTAEELNVLPVNISMNSLDLNNLKKPGQYYGSAGMVNAPEQGEAILEVIRYNNDCLVQKFTSIKSNHKHITYTRGFINRVWSDWVKVYDENNRPTPADIGAIPKQVPRIQEGSLNNVVEAGFYAVAATNVSEVPIKKDGRLIVASWDWGSWSSQLYFPDGGDIYHRMSLAQDGTNWTEWTQVYTKASKPTPQEIGALPLTGGELSGHLIMRPGQKFVGAHSYGYSCRTKEGTDDYVIYIDAENKVHVGYNGRAIKLDSLDIVNSRGKKVYHEDNKPTAADVGAVSKSGDKITGTMKFENTNGNEIEIVNPSQGLQARGMVFKNDYINNNIIGMIGAYLNGTEMVKAFLGTTPTPWDGNKSLTVDKNGVYYNNQKLYYAGNKPTPSDIGAAASNHNHDSAYLGKTDTAANSNKLKNWDIAGASNDYAGIPVISHDGVMELGPILDFHIKGSKKDFDMRVTTREGALEVDKALSAENLWARKYLRINDWYGGDQDGRLWFKGENKKIYTENVEDLVVNNRSIAKGDYWDNDNGNVRVCHLGGGLRLVRQIVKTGYANSGGGVSYTIHFPKAWNWVLPISLVSHNYNDASNNTSGYCTIDHWTNSYLNGGCYQMVAGKPTQIILTYLATE